MFDLRDTSDIVSDIRLLNKLANDYENYRNCVAACIKQCNIKEIIECPEKHDNSTAEGIGQKLNCKICMGTGLKVIFKDDTKEKSND